ncbi:hypothetical protein P7C70_g3250, partial [Phenoliferia sp. Uapishka_3]
MRHTVEQQTYPHVEHWAITDDVDSLSYLDGVDQAFLSTLTKVPFNDTEVCQKCRHLNPEMPTCQAAPWIGSPGRDVFLDCFCSTAFPMNLLINDLLLRLQDTRKSGWVLVLDDDNFLTSNLALSDLMLDPEHSTQLLLFQSYLGRLTPSSSSVGKKVPVLGDIDASNYMFHTSQLPHAMWDAKRCADWRSISHLARLLEVKWSAAQPIMSHPLRPKLGGLGLRNDLSTTLEVVIFMEEGGVSAWVADSVFRYCAKQYRHMVEHIVILASLQHHFALPEECPVIFMEPDLYDTSNSGSDLTLLLDGSIFLSAEALRCLFVAADKTDGLPIAFHRPKLPNTTQHDIFPSGVLFSSVPFRLARQPDNKAMLPLDRGTSSKIVTAASPKHYPAGSYLTAVASLGNIDFTVVARQQSVLDYVLECHNVNALTAVAAVKLEHARIARAVNISSAGALSTNRTPILCGVGGGVGLGASSLPTEASGWGITHLEAGCPGQAAPRTGPGASLELRCSEVSAERVFWLDAVLAWPFCDDIQDTRDILLSSAAVQCGAWWVASQGAFGTSQGQPVAGIWPMGASKPLNQ